LEFGKIKRGKLDMDGTWLPPRKKINYVVCQSCKDLVKKEEIVKNSLKICLRCAQV
jgi:formylmethanofuran dehydrogenase subunit E